MKINPAMEQLLGVPASEVIGRTESEVFGEATGRQIQLFDRRGTSRRIRRIHPDEAGERGPADFSRQASSSQG